MSKAPSVSAVSVESRSAARVVEEIPVIELVEAMPGFPDRTRFALVRLDEDGVLCSLKSVEDPDLRFLVVPPTVFFPDYAPEIDDAVVSALRIERAEDVLVLVVVNTVSRQASQVVLAEDHPVRAPLVA